MAWVRLDDQIFLHPKIVAAGKDATLLHLSGLAYASSQLTDGFIPTAALRVVAATVNVHPKNAARLAELGLWEPVGGGYMIHDYLEYNPSATKVRAERDSAKARMQRLRSPDVRPNNERTAPEVPPSPSRAFSPSPSPSPSQTKRDTEKREKPPTPLPTEAAHAAAVPNAPYRLFARFCEEIGADEGAVSTGEKSKQMGIARAILTEHSEDEAVACAAYLQSQSWRTGLIDLGTVKSEIGKWKMSGSPSQERPRGSPATNGRQPKSFDAIKLDETIQGITEWNAMMDEKEKNGPSSIQSRNGTAEYRLQPGGKSRADVHVLGSGEEPPGRDIPRSDRPPHRHG